MGEVPSECEAERVSLFTPTISSESRHIIFYPFSIRALFFSLGGGFRGGGET